MTLAPTVGIGLPQIPGTGFSASGMGSFITRSEALGFDALWVSELTSAPILDPLGVLAHAAALTRRPRLGVAVLLTPLRAPLQLARDLATLDVLSGGRLTVGVGLGSSRALYPGYGLSAERRLRRYLDGLRLLRLLWTQDDVTFHDEWWHLEGPTRLVRPMQRPHPPIWVGARGHPGIRRAVRTGDGWIGSGSAPWPEFESSVQLVHETLAAEKRERSTFSVGKRVYLVVSDRAASATDRARAWFGANYGNPSLAETAALIGDAPACAEVLNRLTEQGVDHLLLNPIIDEFEQMECLAEKVLPLLRTANPSTAQSVNRSTGT